MLIARAPVRLSFAGGGTDIPPYFRKYGGMVVSTTIDKYFYVFLGLNGQGSIQISSSDYRTIYRHRRGESLLTDGALNLPRAVLHEFGIDRGLSLFLASEVPPGTGLGSSSAVAVALIKSLSTLCERPRTKQEVAELACQIEIERLHQPVGYQDQFASAFGGFNVIEFSANETTVCPLAIAAHTREALERRLMLFFTGVARHSSTILSQQREASEREDAAVIASLDAIKQSARDVRAALEAGRLDDLGALLDYSWRQKKQLARGISNNWIDELYALAIKHGALGGKITGAGGGGFLMLFCREGAQEGVSTALEQRGLHRMDFRFETGGAKVLMNAIPRNQFWLSAQARLAEVAGE